MSRLYDEIVSQRGSLERLVARLPEFKGYQDKQARRQADRLLREIVASQIQQKIDTLIDVERHLLEKEGGMTMIKQTRHIKSKMQHLRDRFKAATPGYSGMWAQMKIGDAELERIYSFDEAMLDYVDRIDKALSRVDDVSGDVEAVDKALNELDTVVDEAHDAYALRDQMFTEFATQI
jgi:soluble cytochrome b562